MRQVRLAEVAMKTWLLVATALTLANLFDLSASDHALSEGASSSASASVSRLIAKATQKKGRVSRWKLIPLARMAVSSLWCESCHIV